MGTMEDCSRELAVGRAVEMRDRSCSELLRWLGKARAALGFVFISSRCHLQLSPKEV